MEAKQFMKKFTLMMKKIKDATVKLWSLAEKSTKKGYIDHISATYKKDPEHVKNVIEQELTILLHDSEKIINTQIYSIGDYGDITFEDSLIASYWHGDETGEVGLNGLEDYLTLLQDNINQIEQEAYLQKL